MKSGDQQEGALKRGPLAAIIAARLELEEEWFSIERFTFFSGKIRNQIKFEQAFKKVLAGGWRWDVMLTCLARGLSYNLEEVRQQPRVLIDPPKGTPDHSRMVVDGWTSDFEDEEESRPRYVSKIAPPAATERERIRANLKAASNVLTRYDTLLFELAMYLPFEDNGLCQDLTPVEAHILLPRLLRWSQKLLTAESIGNARTIKSVGQLVPCVYIELLVSRQKDQSARRILPWLQFVAAILNELKSDGMPPFRSNKMKKESRPPTHSAEQLAEALRNLCTSSPSTA